MNALIIKPTGDDGANSTRMSSKPRGTYLDPLKACALSGVSSFQAGKSESSTYTKFTGITRQTRRTASRTSVLNDVERTRFSSVLKRIESEYAYSTSVLERQRRMFRRSLGDIEKQKRDLMKQKELTGPLAAIGKGNALVRHSMDSDISIPELIKRQKGRSRKRNGLTIRSKAGSKKQLPNTRLPSLTNESIQESSEDEAGLTTNRREESDTGDSQVKTSVASGDSKLSKRTRGSLTLPVFIKTDRSGDTTKSNAAFYTGGDPLKKLKGSDKSPIKVEEKLKLPAINSNDSAEWT